MLQSYLDKAYHVYFDNFYSTNQLFIDLEKRQTFACGTIRKDHGRIPKDFVGKLKRGEMKFIQNGNLIDINWFDKRDVCALSMIHTTGKEEVTRRGDEKSVEKPDMIIQYNKYMNSVDKCDQYLSSHQYQFNQRTLKWWEKVFVPLIDLAVINAMIIFFKNHPAEREKYQAFFKILNKC